MGVTGEMPVDDIADKLTDDLIALKVAGATVEEVIDIMAFKTYYPTKNIWRYTFLRKHCQTLFANEALGLNSAYRIYKLKKHTSQESYYSDFIENYFHPYPETALPRYLPVKVDIYRDAVEGSQPDVTTNTFELSEELLSESVTQPIVIYAKSGCGKKVVLLYLFDSVLSADVGVVPCFVYCDVISKGDVSELVYTQIAQSFGIKELNLSAAQIKQFIEGTNIPIIFLFDLNFRTIKMGDNLANFLTAIKHFAHLVYPTHRVVLTCQKQERLIDTPIHREFGERCHILELHPFSKEQALNYARSMHSVPDIAQIPEVFQRLMNYQEELITTPRNLELLTLLSLEDESQTTDQLCLSLGQHLLKDVESGCPEIPIENQPLFYSATPNFVGRGLELVELSAKYAAHTTLIIDGIAGIGKTELARRFGEELRQYRMCFWVECQESTSVTMLLNEVAKGLPSDEGKKIRLVMKENPKYQGLRDSLVEALNENRGVLFLDSYERVNDSEVHNLVEEISKGMETGKVILTTRQLPTFSSLRNVAAFTGGSNEAALDGLEEDASVLLFQKLGLNQTDRTILLKAHKKLRGHPKLIELFSARARRYGVEAVLRRLPGALKEIEQYLLDELFKELPESSQRLLGCLSVFNNPVPLDGVCAVYADDILAMDELIDRHLASYEQVSGGPQYSMHPLVREFSLAKVESPEVVHANAARYFSRHEKITPVNYKDYIEAHYHFQQACNYDEAAELVVSIAEDKICWGHWGDLAHMLDESIGIGHELPRSIVTRLYEYRGAIWESLGEFEESLENYNEMLQSAQRTGDRSKEGDAYNKIGWLHRLRDNHDAVWENAQSALAIAREVDNRRGIATSKNTLGLVYAKKTQWDEAIRAFQESAEIMREIGYKSGEASSIHNIGIIRRWGGKLDEALEYFQEGLKIREQIQHQKGMADSLTSIGLVYRDKGECDVALDNCQRALEIHRSIHNPDGIAVSLMNVGCVYDVMGKYDEALDSFQESLAICRNIGSKDGKAANLYNIGCIHEKRGEYSEAFNSFQQSLKIYKRLDNKNGIAKNLNSIGCIHQKRGKYKAALRCYRKSLEIKEEVNDRQGIASSVLNIGCVYRELYNIDIALEHHEQALNGAIEVGDKNLESKALANLGFDKIYQGNYTDGGISDLEEALNIARQVGNKSGGMQALYYLAEAWLRKGDLQRPLTMCDQLRVLAERLGAKEYIADWLMIKGQCEPPDANLVESALEIAEELQNPVLLWRIYSALGKIYKAQNQLMKANNAFVKATNIIEKLASSICDEELKNSYLNSEEITTVFRASGRILEPD